MSDPVETPILEAWNPAEVYKRNDSRCWGGDPSRGAAMGRITISDILEDYEAPGFTIHVERILIVEGYDPNGTYWGGAGPLFWIYSEAEVEKLATWVLHKPKYTEFAYIDYCERFVDLEDAVRIVQETWPHAQVIGSEAWCDELVEKYLDEEYERERQDDEDACADATLYEGTVVGSVDEMQIHEILHECIIKPPTLDYDKWAALIERVRLAESVCERLMRIEMMLGASESIDTDAVVALFEDASMVTGIARTHKFMSTDFARECKEQMERLLTEEKALFYMPPHVLITHMPDDEDPEDLEAPDVEATED